jgi:CMP-N,N'-diacetyllegionaminic acid synthase
MEYMVIIPARAGSKGIIGKNKRNLHGKPLICYTFELVHLAGINECSYISTDDPEILNLAEKYNIKHFGLRPPELATDASPTVETIEHELFQYKKIYKRFPDAIILLQPTSPLRSADHVNEAIKLFEKSSCNALVSVQKVDHNMIPSSLMQMDNLKKLTFSTDDKIFSRHEKPVFYARNGAAIYISYAENILKHKSIFGSSTIGYEMDKLSSIDIDDEEDWKIVEALISV